MIAELMLHPRGWLNQQIVRGPNDMVTTDDQITVFDHDARGNLTKVTSPDGSFATLTYDLAENHIHIEELNPRTGEVLQNYHLRWPSGAGR